MERVNRVFSEPAKATLLGNRHYIHKLTGNALYDFGGGIIESGWHRYRSYFAFESTTSMLSEVSFDPKSFVIATSHSLPFSEQMKMVLEYEADLQRKIPDIRAIVGNITDYVELYSLHLRRRPQDRLLGRHQSVRTSTRIFQNGILYVGPNQNTTTLYIDHGDASHREGHIMIAPLIIPAFVI